MLYKRFQIPHKVLESSRMLKKKLEYIRIYQNNVELFVMLWIVENFDFGMPKCFGILQTVLDH